MSIRALAAFALLFLTACASAPDPVAGYSQRNDIGAFPQPHTIVQQVITVVGPPGAQWCGRIDDPSEHRAGADGSVVLRLPPVHDRAGPGRGYWPISVVRCWVVTPEFPRGRFMQRVIHDIQLPMNGGLRAQYIERLSTARAAGCPEWNVTAESMGQTMFCDIPRTGYGAITVGSQPYIIHVGRRADIDTDAARARWQALRQAVAERCLVEQTPRCAYLEDDTWALFEAADLNRTFDARNSDN